MRKILATLSAAAVLLVGGGFLLSNTASAAPEDASLIGKRVLCVTSNGDFKALDAPCSAHLNADHKTPMWYAGPLPVPGAAGYADSVKAIVGSGGGVGPAGPQGPKGEPGTSAVSFIAKKVTVPAHALGFEVTVVQPAMSAVVAPGSDPQPGTDLVTVHPPAIPLSATLVSSATSRVFKLDGASVDREVTVWLFVAQR